MENKISQSFKVQWLNDTLKFIRNDNQLTMDYPKMSIAHVEYFYNSLCQREDQVGLGYRSLFSPLWEAMAASHEKYEFKISIAQTETNDMGQLLIKKIPKNADDYQNKTVHDINKIPSLKSPKLRELIKHETVKTIPMSTNSNVKPITKLKSNETVRKEPKKKTKSQKYFEQTKKTIDSIAPAFFKTIFTKIYAFLNDESSASLTFLDLAPNEALFLQNFLGIYNRRAVLDIMFSPFCNDLLEKMAALFKEFDKQSKLDICVGKTDMKTSKREITFLKVPRYTKNTSTKAKLTYYANSDLPSTSENQADSSGNKLLGAFCKTTALTNATDTSTNSVINSIDKKDLDKETKFELSTIEKSAVFTNTNNKQTKSADNNKNDVKTHNNIQSLNTNERYNIESVTLKETEKHNVYGTPNHKIKEIYDAPKTVETKTNKTNTDNIFTKSIKNIMEKDIENKKINIDSNASIGITVSNKKLLNTDNNNDTVRSVFLKDNNKKPIRKGISFEKANHRTDNENVTDENTDTVIKGVNRNRHNKLLEAMSTPLESDRAMRMMHLMGWEGGALGLRGEGITEPIIPAINITPGAGLGHISLKSQKRQEKSENRLQFLQAILNLLTIDNTEIELLFNYDITKKEKRVFRDIISVVNSKKTLNLSKTGESEVCEIINEKMADANIQLEVAYHSRKLTFYKINITDAKENIDKTKKQKKIKTTTTSTQSQIITKTIKLPAKKTEFRILVLDKVINFITEDENRILNLHFDDILCVKHRNFVRNLCKSVNNRETFTNIKVQYRSLFFDVYENFTDYFDLHYGEDFQSFTIEKVDEYRELTKRNSKIKEITKKKINDNLNETSLESIVTVERAKHNEKHKKNYDTDKNDNNNNCNTKLVETKKEAISTAISKKNKSFIILIKLENGKNGTEIYKLIVDKINEEIDFMPYLKSHGIENGYLVYSCYNKMSCLWLKNVLKEHLDDTFIEYGGSENKFVLCMKIRTKLRFEKVLSMLEMYNPGSNCMEWELWRPFCEKSLDFLIRVNYDSFDYIRSNYFKLHAGFDEIEFSVFID